MIENYSRHEFENALENLYAIVHNCKVKLNQDDLDSLEILLDIISNFKLYIYENI
jgi:hypothetical protein